MCGGAVCDALGLVVWWWFTAGLLGGLMDLRRDGLQEYCVLGRKPLYIARFSRRLFEWPLGFGLCVLEIQRVKLRGVFYAARPYGSRFLDRIWNK
jgi:hypothetical protein